MTVTAGHQGHDGTSDSRATLRRRTSMSAPFGTSNGLCTHNRWLPVGAYRDAVSRVPPRQPAHSPMSHGRPTDLKLPVQPRMRI